MGTFSMTAWAYARRNGAPVAPPSAPPPNPYYQPPYAAQGARDYEAPNLGYRSQPDYAPPAGPPPPTQSADDLPGYGTGAYDGGKDISDAKALGDARDAKGADDPFADWESARR
jgi:hypothetical protein